MPPNLKEFGGADCFWVVLPFITLSIWSGMIENKR